MQNHALVEQQTSSIFGGIVIGTSMKKKKLDEIYKSNDLYTLGLHLHLDHGLTDPNKFDNNISFRILEVVNLVDIERKEFQWMH